jgi:hypothetical protein
MRVARRTVTALMVLAAFGRPAGAMAINHLDVTAFNNRRPSLPPDVYLRGRVESVLVGSGRVTLTLLEARPPKGAPRYLSGRSTLLLGVGGRGPRLAGAAPRDVSLGRLRPGTVVEVGLGRLAEDGLLPLRSLALVDEAGKITPWRQLPTEPWPMYTEQTSGERVVAPLIFPVMGGAPWHDTFLAMIRGHLHLGQDLLGPKMRPLLAAFDGTVYLLPATASHPANTIILVGDGPWQALYTHLNDDSPGTADHCRDPQYAFAPGVENGARVGAGQLLGWIGDSGQASGPHCHFELRDLRTGVVLNAAPSLHAAGCLNEPWCLGVAGNLRPLAGEMRIDGYVAQFDRERGVLDVRVRSRSEKGHTTAVSQPQHAWARCQTVLPRLLGCDPATAPWFDWLQVKPGAFVVMLGVPGSASLAAREVWVERCGLAADDGLAAALAALRP